MLRGCSTTIRSFRTRTWSPPSLLQHRIKSPRLSSCSSSSTALLPPPRLLPQAYANATRSYPATHTARFCARSFHGSAAVATSSVHPEQLDPHNLMDHGGEAGDARAKRKHAPTTPGSERPMKQIKAQPDLHGRNGSFSRSSPDLCPQDEPLSPSMESSYDEMAPTHIAGGVHDTAEWQKTIEHVVRNVVSIHFCQTCSFDTDGAVSSEATGFVVDAEKGYILTNRVSGGGSRLAGRWKANRKAARCRRWSIHRLLYLRQS